MYDVHTVNGEVEPLSKHRYLSEAKDVAQEASSLDTGVTYHVTENGVTLAVFVNGEEKSTSLGGGLL